MGGDRSPDQPFQALGELCEKINFQQIETCYYPFPFPVLTLITLICTSLSYLSSLFVIKKISYVQPTKRHLHGEPEKAEIFRKPSFLLEKFRELKCKQKPRAFKPQVPMRRSPPQLQGPHMSLHHVPFGGPSTCCLHQHSPGSSQWPMKPSLGCTGHRNTPGPCSWLLRAACGDTAGRVPAPGSRWSAGQIWWFGGLDNGCILPASMQAHNDNTI